MRRFTRFLSCAAIVSLFSASIAVAENPIHSAPHGVTNAWYESLLSRAAAEAGEQPVWRQAVGDTWNEGDPPVLVEFRQLFNARGKPSARAVELNGRVVEMVGFLTPPPTDDSPFLVFVGAPTAACPYCEAINELDHPAYALIYHKSGIDRAGLRARVRVRGVLQAEHLFEDFYGIHNDVRLLDAHVWRDAPRRNPVLDRKAQSDRREKFGLDSTGASAGNPYGAVTAETVD